MTRAAERLRSVAFYLPQFHPIPENDRWWGPGYTEWDRVTAASPQFRGHVQPRRPSEFGLYDLRDADVREAQAALASTYNIDAFCYYHYWFGGHRLLEQPFESVLESGRPQQPFMLCWANEPWTRAWDGRSGEVLQPQVDDQDPADHIRTLLPAFADDRYLRVSGRPLFLIYRASLVNDPNRLLDAWRAIAVAEGVGEPWFAAVESFPADRHDPRSLGFDGAVEFQPDWSLLGFERSPTGLVQYARARTRSLRVLLRGHRVHRYSSLAAKSLSKGPVDYPRWPGVTVGWDNTARRRRNATIIDGSTPERYAAWLAQVAERAVADTSTPAPLVFVNAWNEWSEGAYLEPDARNGTAYLDAHRRVMDAYR